MPGFSTIGSTPIGMVLRRVVIRAGAIRADVGQAGVAVSVARSIEPDAIALDLAKLSGDLVPTVSISLPAIELQAFHLVDQATAAGSIDLAAIQLQTLGQLKQLQAWQVIAADPIAADLVEASLFLEQSATWQAVAGEVLESTSAAGPSTAAGLAPGAIELQTKGELDQLQTWQAIAADPIQVDLEKTAEGLVPTVSISLPAIELQAFHLVDQATAAGSIDLAAIELQLFDLAGLVIVPRTIPADALRVDPRPAIADLVYTLIIQGGAIELQAFQMPRQATAAGSIDLAAAEASEGVLGGLVSGSRTIPAGLVASDLVAASESLVPAATWQAIAAEVLESTSAADPTAAAGLAPGAIQLQAGDLADVVSGSIELQAFAFQLCTGTENRTTKTEVLLQFFSFDLAATPSQAEGQTWQAIAADPIQVDLEKTAEGLVPTVSISLPAIELQAFHLVDQATAAGSIDLAAIELQLFDLAGLVIVPRTIPADAIAAELEPIAWRGFGPVLIGPPELVYTLPSAWPYYCLADNRLAYDLDDQRLAFDLVDNRLGYDLGPGWYQFDLRGNSLIYRLEE